MKNDYFRALTGYRALAAYMVFFTHNNMFERGSFMYSFVACFGLGVPLFFVLSGFLIYTRYNESKVSGPFYKKYMLNRVARIYPIYFLITTATWLFNYKAAAFTPYWLKVYILNITFLRGFLEAYNHTLVVVGWSLTVEETFYLLAPIMFMFAGDSIKKYLFTFVIFMSFGWIVSFISVEGLNGLLWSHHKFMMTNTFFGHSFAFVVGIIVGVLHKNYKEASFKYYTVVGFAGIILSLLILSQVNNPLGEGTQGVYTWKGIFIWNIFSIPFIGALIWGLVHETTYVSRLFSTELFQVLGKSSYTFYLIHEGIITSIIRKFGTESVIPRFFILIALSYVIWRFIEEPLNEMIRSRGKKILGV